MGGTATHLHRDAAQLWAGERPIQQAHGAGPGGAGGLRGTCIASNRSMRVAGSRGGRVSDITGRGEVAPLAPVAPPAPIIGAGLAGDRERGAVVLLAALVGCAIRGGLSSACAGMPRGLVSWLDVPKFKNHARALEYFILAERTHLDSRPAPGEAARLCSRSRAN